MTTRRSLACAAADTATLTVTENAATYTLGMDGELTSLADARTLDLSAITPLADGSYEVIATASDESSNELTITP